MQVGDTYMKEKIHDNGWFQTFFVDYPIGFVIVLVLALSFFVSVSQKTEIPVYETSTTVIYEDANGYYIKVSERLDAISTPFYIYQLRDQYVEKVEAYTIDMQKQVIYLNNTAFKARDEVFVDIESNRISLLEYFFE